MVGFSIERGQQDVTDCGLRRWSAQQEEARKTCHGRMLHWEVLAAARLLCATGAMRQKKDDITTSWCWHFDVHLDTLFPAPPDSIENMDDLGRTLGETLGNPIHMILMLKADGLPSTDQGQKLS